MMKDITGYEGLYAITDNGEVWSYRNKKFLKKKENPNGYYYAELWRNNKGKGFRVNRLVAEAFIPNPNNYPCVNHKDENKLNNKVSNLEWCTYKYNNNYGTCTERMRKTLTGRRLSEEHRAKISAANKGKIHPKGWSHSEETKAKISESNSERRKAVKQSAKDGSVVAYYKSIWEASKQTGISSSQITGCCNQKKDYKTAGGYLWSFATENAFDEWLEQNQ